MKCGLLEMSAQVIGVFGGRRVFGIQRDGVWFTYALKFAAADIPGLMEQLDYLDISYDSHQTEHFGKYLRERIDRRFFESGGQVLLLDTGFRGGILNAMRLRFPGFENRIQALFTASNNPEVMVSRVFQWAAYGPGSTRKNPGDLLIDSHQIEIHLPKDRNRVEHYEFHDGKWRPVLYRDNSTHLDGEINHDLHRFYRRDLGEYLALKENKVALAQRIELWRTLTHLAHHHRLELVTRLKEILASNDELAEPIVRDAVDFFPSKVTLADVELSTIPGDHHRNPSHCLTHFTSPRP